MIPIDEKRLKDREERRRRLLNQGVPSEKVDAMMNKQDWENLSPDRKIEVLQTAMQNNFQQMGQAIHNLRYNDTLLGDVLDVNFRMIAMAFASLGVTTEQQKEFMQKAVDTLRTEHLERRKAQEEAQKASEAQKQGDSLPGEKEALQELMTNPNSLTTAPQKEEFPAGASIFGG